MSDCRSGQNDWENEQVFQRNRLPARSYLSGERTVSLNGRWRFHYAASPLEAPPNDQDKDTWTRTGEDIIVPGHWQLQGYGEWPPRLDTDGLEVQLGPRHCTN